ncbi:MAG: FtsQ-type POTRA domain-containing protein [Gemmatimonadota bacterium]
MFARVVEWLRLHKKMIGASALAAVVLTSVLWLPPLLRPLDFFHVRSVSVRGIRYLDARALVRSMQIDSGTSIWNSLDPFAARVAAHPQVRSVSIGRRLPSTLVVTIAESIPVALVPTPNAGMRAFDEEARQLPLDPTRVDVDLPILSRADTALLRLLADLRRLDPPMFARVSEVERTGRDEAIVFLSSLPVRVRSSVSAERFAELRAVEEDLTRRGAKVAELDLRFRDRVIARLQ